MEYRDKLKDLLDDYYGNSRNDGHKEEIIDFLDANIWSIASIFKDQGII